MPRKRTQKIYFGEDQEKAVVMYLESTDEAERNKIFNEYLREPLIIMVESIIRRYKLYRKDQWCRYLWTYITLHFLSLHLQNLCRLRKIMQSVVTWRVKAVT
mgnify:CR=1 FL=1